jgi:hypothetical protein
LLWCSGIWGFIRFHGGEPGLPQATASGSSDRDDYPQKALSFPPLRAPFHLAPLASVPPTLLFLRLSRITMMIGLQNSTWSLVVV